MTSRGTTYGDWVWHTTGPDARSAVEKEFEALPVIARASLSQRMDKFQAGTHAPRDVKNLGNGLMEIRVKIGSNPYRLIFFCHGRIPVALTVFKKKTQQTSQKDLKRAQDRMATWLAWH